MPNTRKKVIKTVYKDKDSEDETGDFSDSGSEAQISEPPSSDEEEIEENVSSADEFDCKSRKNRQKQPVKKTPKFAKKFLGKLNEQTAELEDADVPLSQFSVKDLTDSDKLLPSVLNLSESDSSDDETPKASGKKTPSKIPYTIQEQDESENEVKEDYSDVWAKNLHDDSAEVAKKAFMELEQHKNTIEETKASLQNYASRSSIEQEKESNVTDLLALGEEVAPKKTPVKKKTKSKRRKDDSESEMEDWEEVKESKAIPQQGLQLVVALPDSLCRKSKKIDVEMMMRRKINRVKKEHQVFMHKVHVLCWIGHGNYVNQVLNDQEIMAAVLAMVPKGCYPENRLNMKYVEQITAWFKDKLTLKQDKNEHKFRPKAPPLKTVLLNQIKSRVVTAKKYSVLIFVAMLRALGLQCRIMYNFVTVPLKPPISELCSLATKPKDEKSESGDKKEEKPKAAKPKPKTTRGKAKAKSNEKLPQVDGTYDSFLSSFREFENIMQLDGNDDAPKTKSLRSTRAKRAETVNVNNGKEEDVSPPKRSKKETEASVKTALKTNTLNKSESSKSSQPISTNKAKGDHPKNESKSNETVTINNIKSPKSLSLKKVANDDNKSESTGKEEPSEKSSSPRKTRSSNKTTSANKITSSDKISKTSTSALQTKTKLKPPNIIITDENQIRTQSKYFENSQTNNEEIKGRPTRKRSLTTVASGPQKSKENLKDIQAKARTRSAGSVVKTSKYFEESESEIKKPKMSAQQLKKQEKLEDEQRMSHRDLPKLRSPQSKTKMKNDVTGDLIDIIKGRIKGAKEDAKKGIVKGKVKEESDDSDYLPVENIKHRDSESDEDFKPTKISPRAPKLSAAVPSTSKKHIDRRVLSSDDEATKTNKVDVWCEIFVEELEQWIAVDVINGKVHCTGDIYSHASHPVCYIVGWDNSNYLKDLTRRYVPHWNTVTRKLRAEPQWWDTAVQPWLGPSNARDREEDISLDIMQLEAPLPKSIAEYKNHPLYALKRHLLKYEALYPADAAVLGFVRGEPVHSRQCVHVCRSRDTWLKEAKVVRLGEAPYKIVKARPKWDRLSNKCITDKPLEVFGPWQVQDYEPPTAAGGVVPRNAYGNVELFKECMLPKGTVHIKLPGLNKVARKMNIDCAPAMTGFDFNGGWSHPVYDGFVVCEEFEELVTEAWVKDQEDQVRREREKIELRVYGNWKRLIKGLLIRERLKLKYGFEEPSTSQAAKNKKGPRLVVKKKS